MQANDEWIDPAASGLLTREEAKVPIASISSTCPDLSEDDAHCVHAPLDRSPTLV